MAQQLDVNAMVDAVLEAVSAPIAALGERLRALEDREPQIGDKGDPGEPGRPGEPGQPGRDGVGLAAAMIDRAGELVVTLTDGTMRSLGLVIGRDGDPGKDGQPGKDGLGFDDMGVELAGDRTVTFRFARNGDAREFPLVFPVHIYRGVFNLGDRYQRGDMVTFSGSLWHCNLETDERPGDASKAWTLAAKRGRDGKNGKDGEPGKPGTPGKNGSLEPILAIGEPGAAKW
jgi:integrin beta 3